MTTVLLTGASGYIGKHIALELLNQGYTVRASVRSLSKSAEVINAVTPHLLDTSKLDTRLTFIELDLEKDAPFMAANFQQARKSLTRHCGLTSIIR